MVALITKTSDWKFRKVIKDFTFSEASLRKLIKKYGENSFVITLDPFDAKYDIAIEIYDDYREQTTRSIFFVGQKEHMFVLPGSRPGALVNNLTTNFVNKLTTNFFSKKC